MLNPNFRRCSPSFHHFLWPWGERPCHGPLRSFSSPVPRSPSAPLGPRCQSPGRWGSAPPGGGIWEFDVRYPQIVDCLVDVSSLTDSYCAWSSWLDLTCLTMISLDCSKVSSCRVYSTQVRSRLTKMEPLSVQIFFWKTLPTSSKWCGQTDRALAIPFIGRSTDFHRFCFSENPAYRGIGVLGTFPWTSS